MKIFVSKADPATPHEAETTDRVIDIAYKIDDDFDPSSEGEAIADALWSALPGATCDRLLEAMLRRRASQLRVSRAVFDPAPSSSGNAAAVPRSDPGGDASPYPAGGTAPTDRMGSDPMVGDCVRVIEGARYGMVGRLDRIVSGVTSTLLRVEIRLPGRPVVLTDSVAHSYVSDEMAIGRQVTVTGSDWNGIPGKLVARCLGRAFMVNVNGVFMLTTSVFVLGRATGAG